MSFQVKLWAYTKPVNSTAIPSAAPAETMDCSANGRMSVTAPALKINAPAAMDLSIYNYAEIPAFHRYYWITDWIYDRGLWYCSMDVDVLASYKAQIGALSPYILRSSHTYDGTITDTLYPAKAVYSESRVAISNPWEYGTQTSGCFSVGIVSAGGLTSFWLMSRTTLDQLMTYLLSDQYAEDVIGTLALTAYPEAKAIIEPLQYISAVTWLPISLPQTLLTAVKVGYSVISLDVAYASPSMPLSFSYSFTRPTHPQAAARGAYMNAAPYTMYSLFFPPFGKVDIGSAFVLAQNAISVNVYLDRCLGNGTLEIKAGDYVLSRVNARIGMPVQLSQVIAPGYGILSAAGAAGGIAANIFSGNYVGAALGAASGIADAIKSQIPSVNSVGSIGSCDTLLGAPALQASFANTVDDDLACRGRPLCQVKQISTIPGYIVCADVEIHIQCTEQEHQEIKAFMESGFFYA